MSQKTNFSLKKSVLSRWPHSCSGGSVSTMPCSRRLLRDCYLDQKIPLYSVCALPSTSFAFSLLFVYLGTLPGISPVRQSVCTHNAPSPIEAPLSLTLPTSDVAKQPATMRAGAFSSQSNHLSLYFKASRKRRSPFKIKPFFIRVVHTLHDSCSFFLLRMYASEDWAFKRRCPSCKCRQATARWQHGRFSAYHTWASLFFFVLLLLSNPDSHTLPVKHLWFLFFLFFLQMSLTPFCLCYHHFAKHTYCRTIKSCSTSEILTRQAGILLQFGYVCR